MRVQVNSRAVSSSTTVAYASGCDAMASLANPPAMLLACLENWLSWLTLNSGVEVDHRYSCELGRWAGGRGSHSTVSRCGRCIFEHSAKLLTRLYRNVPPESSRAYCP